MNMLLRSILASWLLLAATAVATTSNDADDWDWSRTHMWMEFGTGGKPLTPYQAEFAAMHYDIIGVGGVGVRVPYQGEVAQAAAAMQLKKYNKNIKVLIYRNSNLVIEGGLHSDLEFLAHPEWTLKNSSGSPIYNNGNTQPFINFTNPAAREWWVNSIVSAITQQPNGTAIDGVYSDGAGDFEVLFRGLAPGQNSLLNASHALAVQELTKRLHAIRPGMLNIGNGAVMAECGRTDEGMHWTPCARNLPLLDGVCAEHFGSFESVNASTGNYDTDGGAAQNYHGVNVNEKWQTALDIVKRFDGGSQVILTKSWPGPFSMYNGQFTWKNLSDANITLTNELRKTYGAAALPWAHAAFLLSVAPNSYMSYGWWYQISTGYVPCPDDPSSCACPDEWYPALKKPTGKPLGPRRRIAGTVWARDFEKVSVRVDLGNFSEVSLVWK